MMNFVFKKLHDFIEYFQKEQKIEKFKMERGRLNGEELERSKEWNSIYLVIWYSYFEFEKELKKMSEDFRAFVVFGEWREGKHGLWPNFYTFKKILVKGEENKGPQEKAINLKFNPVLDISKMGPGYLVVEKCKCKQPKIYEITEDEKGKHYPYIWVDEIYSFDPFPIEEIKEDEKNI